MCKEGGHTVFFTLHPHLPFLSLHSGGVVVHPGFLQHGSGSTNLTAFRLSLDYSYHFIFFLPRQLERASLK